MADQVSDKFVRDFLLSYVAPNEPIEQGGLT
jgi:hypothetical protein